MDGRNDPFSPGDYDHVEFYVSFSTDFLLRCVAKRAAVLAFLLLTDAP